jgi:hypothetical protein
LRGTLHGLVICLGLIAERIVRFSGVFGPNGSFWLGFWIRSFSLVAVEWLRRHEVEGSTPISPPNFFSFLDLLLPSDTFLSPPDTYGTFSVPLFARFWCVFLIL